MATIFNILIRTNIRRKQVKQQQQQQKDIRNALQRIFASKAPETRILTQANAINYEERLHCMLPQRRHQQHQHQQQHHASSNEERSSTRRREATRANNLQQQHYTQVQQLALAQRSVDRRTKAEAKPAQSVGAHHHYHHSLSSAARMTKSVANPYACSSSSRSSSSRSSSGGGSCACAQDAATLELKSRSPFGAAKLLHVGVTLDDARSLLYLTLLALIYCSVLIRASAATAMSTPTTIPTPVKAAEASASAITGSDNVAIVSSSVVDNLRQQQQQQQQYHTTINTNTTTTTTTRRRSLNTAPNTQMQREDASTTKTATTTGRRRRDAANVPATNEDDDSNYHDDEFDEYDALINNKSAKGKYIGAPCNEMRCEPTLLHVACDKETLTCGCEKNYPVKLGPTKGCDKPKKLGEQCFYDATCMFNDENSLCVQVRHNALCQCANGFHSVSYTKPTRRVFCTQDLKELSSDLPTLLGVSTGIAVLAGLICMVLHLFSKTKYPRHRNFGDANLPPPIMYSSDTGIPLTVQSGRPSSRSSIRSSGSIGSYGNRRSSSGGLPLGGGGGGGGGGGSGGPGGSGIGIGGPGGIGGAGSTSGSKGILVSTSRTGSRRPSLASVHSTSSSVRSYSMMRFEKEAQQKEIRQEMKLRLARLQQQQQLNQNKPQIVIGDTLLHHGALGRITMTATPSPLTPNSTDELLPAVDELQEYPNRLMEPTTSKAAESVASDTLTTIRNIATTSANAAVGGGGAGTGAAVGFTASSAVGGEHRATGGVAYIGPCSSSTEAL